jgi:hypothetical protein
VEEVETAAANLARLRNAAIRMADKIFRISMPRGQQEPVYDPALKADGVTTTHVNVSDTRVRIGESAFHLENMPHGGLLAATKCHEFIHVEQRQDGRSVFPLPPGTAGRQMALINEIEAYRWQAAHVHDFFPVQPRTMGTIFDGHAYRLYIQLTPANRARIDRGDYSTTHLNAN